MRWEFCHHSNYQCSRIDNFFQGCRAGDGCPFAHVSGAGSPSERSAVTDQQRNDPNENTVPPNEYGSSNLEAVQFQPSFNGVAYVTDAPNLHAVPKPISHAEVEDPREFQINQIRRRFRPKERHDVNGTHLIFTMTPSDPDFSYKLSGLECILHVPDNYPMHEVPSLEITNEDLDIGKRDLVQQRFKQLANDLKSGSILRWMTVLDRSLERTLSLSQISDADTRDDSKGVDRAFVSKEASTPLSESPPLRKSRDEAGDFKRREREVAQLVSRLGKDPSFFSHSDRVRFTVPINPVKQSILPKSLQNLKTVTLIVSSHYPREPCCVAIPGVTDRWTRSTEKTFNKHVIDNPGASLVAHINYLAAMMHRMAYRDIEEDTKLDQAVKSVSLEDNTRAETITSTSQTEPTIPPPGSLQPLGETEDRPHIHVIPRPPEWGHPNDTGDEDESDSQDDLSSEGSFYDDEEDETGGVRVPDTPDHYAGRGVALSFPSLELDGVELLEIRNLCLTIKCDRCKELHDVNNIKIGEDGFSQPHSRVESCKKCANYLSIGRSEKKEQIFIMIPTQIHFVLFPY